MVTIRDGISTTTESATELVIPVDSSSERGVLKRAHWKVIRIYGRASMWVDVAALG